MYQTLYAYMVVLVSPSKLAIHLCFRVLLLYSQWSVSVILIFLLGFKSENGSNIFSCFWEKIIIFLPLNTMYCPRSVYSSQVASDAPFFQQAFQDMPLCNVA